MKEKLQIATALLGDLNHDRSEKHEKNETIMNNISIQIEAIGMRLMDLEKDALMFKRDVLMTNDACNVGGGKQSDQLPSSATTATTVIKGDKLLRHFQSKALQLDSTKDKLKLQQIDQKKKLQKIEIKLKQRDEMGSNFHYIDFHQLQTSNKQCMKELKHKTKELDKMKILVEKSERDIVDLEAKLKEVRKEKSKVVKSLELRCRHLDRLQEKVQRHDHDIEIINKGKDVAPGYPETKSEDHEQTNPLNKANVDIMDIVNQQTKIYELQSAIKTWTKKVEIAQLVKKNQKSKDSYNANKG